MSYVTRLISLRAFFQEPKVRSITTNFSYHQNQPICFPLKEQIIMDSYYLCDLEVPSKDRRRHTKNINLKIPKAYGLADDKKKKSFFSSKKRTLNSRQASSELLNHRSLLGCYNKITISAEEQEQIKVTMSESRKLQEVQTPTQVLEAEYLSFLSIDEKDIIENQLS